MTSRQHSIDAYRALLHSGRISGVRAQVCVWLYDNAPATRNELDRALGGGAPNPPFSRRLSELRAMGVIHVVGERDGADLWDVTERGPTGKPPRRPKRKIIESAFSTIASLLERPPEAPLLEGPTLTAIRQVVEKAKAEVGT